MRTARKVVKNSSPRSRRRARRTPSVASQAGILVVNMIPNSLSGEAEQDSEPSIAVNPANPLQVVGTAFTPDPFGGPMAPIFVSEDGGLTWILRSTVPSDTQTGDISIGFGGDGGNLYSGILKLPGSLLLNILRTGDATGSTPMTVLSNRGEVDQPFVRTVTVSGQDRVYVGNNDFNAPGGRTATVDRSLNAGAASPSFASLRIEKRGTGSAGQDGPQIRPAAHGDGTVYAAFYGWRSFSQSRRVTADVVVVRDDDAATGPNAFTALVDPSDGVAGRRATTGVQFTWDARLGNQRIGGDIAIAVDPTDSDIVYLAWADVRSNTGYTIHLRRSTDRGVTWSANDLRTVGRATNPALAINDQGKVCFLHQRVSGSGASQRWVTTVERSTDAVNWTSDVLANTPASFPVPLFQPYIGDYAGLTSVGKDFFGIFSANNSPDRARFPNGVIYQRNHDFTTRRLLDLDGVTPVAVSIDPFFFKITE